jgi:hypothetical protein
VEEFEMSIVNQLSSQVGDRTEASNRQVAVRCLAEPALLAEIADGFKCKDANLLGDCAEVMTEVAKERPELIAPYASELVVLLDRGGKKARVRWETMHALALIAALVPDVIAALLPRLGDMLHSDSSVIVRDCIVDALGNYAQVSADAARAAYPYLKEALEVWDGKQAARALNGLGNVAASVPELAGELQTLGERYLDDRRAVVRKAARILVKALKRG